MNPEKLFVTGESGVGKSTVITRLQQRYPDRLAGIVAAEIVNQHGEREGFSSGTLENPALFVIAHKDIVSDTALEIFGIDIDALDKVAGELAVQVSKAKEANLVVVFDEIGLMQSFSDRLREEMEALIVEDVPAIMTIKLDDSMSEWLREIKQKPGIRLLTITEDTRDEVLDELSRYIEQVHS